MRLTAAARKVVKARDETIKKTRAGLRAAKSDAASKGRALKKAERKNRRLEGKLKNSRAENKKLKRKLRYHEGPSAPGVKNKADRKRDGEAKKKEREREAGGGKRRRPGAQKGHPANRRQYKVTRRVVIDEEDRACKKAGCDGKRRVTGYARKIMVDEKPRPDPDVIESQCPETECDKCGCRGITTCGTAVPIHMFRARDGDAEPDLRAAEAESAGKQASPAEAPEPAAGPAPGGAAEIDWARLNDIPDSPDKPFYIRHPKKGEFGPNVITRAIMNWAYRLTIRKNQASLRADGIVASVGAISQIITNVGDALGPVLVGNIERLQKAKILHVDKMSYRVNGRHWNLWVFYDPLSGNVVYWLTRDKDGDALDRVLGDWNGFVVCDGAPVFNRYNKKQRCWAHILRESHYIGACGPHRRRAGSGCPATTAPAAGMRQSRQAQGAAAQRDRGPGSRRSPLRIWRRRRRGEGAGRLPCLKTAISHLRTAPPPPSPPPPACAAVPPMQVRCAGALVRIQASALRGRNTGGRHDRGSATAGGAMEVGDPAFKPAPGRGLAGTAGGAMEVGSPAAPCPRLPPPKRAAVPAWPRSVAYPCPW